MLGVEVASNRCSLFCVAKLTCLFLFSYFIVQLNTTQAVGRILAVLGKPDGWLVLLCMGGIDCHMLCIVGAVHGNGGAFVIGMGGVVVKEQIITSM